MTNKILVSEIEYIDKLNNELKEMFPLKHKNGAKFFAVPSKVHPSGYDWEGIDNLEATEVITSVKKKYTLHITE